MFVLWLTLLCVLLGYVVFLLFFFFKQKTAYEMRISDWSSDVCSSDLQCVDRRSLGQRRRLDRLGLRQRRHGGLGEGGRGHRKGGEAGKTVGTGVAHELGSGIPLVTRGRPRAGPGRRGGAGANRTRLNRELSSRAASPVKPRPPDRKSTRLCDACAHVQSARPRPGLAGDR